MSNEETSQALICAYFLDGRGGGREVGWDGMDEQAADGVTRWVHVNFSSPQARAWVRERAGLSEFVAEALLAEDVRPRTIEHDNGLLVILRGVNRNPGANPEDMVSVRIWIEPGRIISARRRRVLSVNSLRADIAAGNGPENPSDFLRIFVEKLGERIEPVIDDLDETLEDMESQFEAATEASFSSEFTSVRRQAVRIRRYLSPQRDGLERLSLQRSDLLSDNDRFALREQADRLTRNLEDLDLIRERAMVAQEEMLGRYAQEQNSRIYLLSIVAALFLPLSFLTGLMGMNVAGMPGVTHPWSFAILVLLMVAVAGGIMMFFRWKRWL